MFSLFRDNLKNIGGWTTKRRLVVFNVDDYGNVRLRSPDVPEQLLKAGLKLANRMDYFDALETRQDLERLFGVLDSVRDCHDRPAVFTTYTTVGNPDFATIRQDKVYSYELLPKTFARLAVSQAAAYQGAWELWREGMSRGWIRPQFHGREHLNLTLFAHKLNTGAADLLRNLECESMAGIASDLPGIGFTQAFALTTERSIETQLEIHREAIISGLNSFEEIFGFRSQTFTPPSQTIHTQLYTTLEFNGVHGIDKPFRCQRQVGNGRVIVEKNRTGQQANQKHVTVVRNVVFEPAEIVNFDPVERALRLIQAAFRWGKPAIISSHRVNFCGHIDPSYRAKGLANLKRLLDLMVQRWPDIEFIGADQLVEIIDGSAK